MPVQGRILLEQAHHNTDQPQLTALAMVRYQIPNPPLARLVTRPAHGQPHGVRVAPTVEEVTKSAVTTIARKAQGAQVTPGVTQADHADVVFP